MSSLGDESVLVEQKDVGSSPAEPPSSRGFFVSTRDGLFSAVLYVLEQLGSYVELTLSTVAWIFRRPFRVDQYLGQLEFVGVGSTFIIVVTGLFSGMVLALQTVHSLREYGAESTVGGI